MARTVSTESRVKQLKTVWQLKGPAATLPIINNMKWAEVRDFCQTFGLEWHRSEIVDYVNRVCQEQLKIVIASQEATRKMLEENKQ